MSQIERIASAVRFIGLSNSINSIRYALEKTATERRISSTSDADQNANSPGPIHSVHKDQNPVRIQCSAKELEVFILGPAAFRMTWLPGKLPIPYAIAKEPVSYQDFDVDIQPGLVVIHTLAARVEIFDHGSIKFYDSTGHLVRYEQPPKFFASGWQHLAEPHPHEALFGLGLRASELNLRGKKFSAWNTDPGGVYNPGDDPLYYCVPTCMGVSPAGSYLVFYENYHRGEFDFSSMASARFTDGALQYYVFLGTPQEILAGYLQLTGHPTLPPRWALGYHQSRWGYKTEEDIQEIVQNFHQNELPLDAIHLDIDYMDGYRVFTVDPNRFPDLTRLSRELTAQNIRLVVILDPGVKIDPGYRLYAHGISEKLFLVDPSNKPVSAPVWPGWCVFPDFGKASTREWWGKQYASLLAAGVSGFWHDMNEPATFPAWGDPTLPLSTIHQLDGSHEAHLAGHNIYGFLMNKAGYESLRKLEPERRPWILSRSGWAGNQRYAWNWTGDVNSTWEALQQLVATMLNLTLSGQYFSGSDIGGFSAHPDPELYLRWFQLGAFSPFFRLHSATGLPPREPWHFDDHIVQIIKHTLELRKQLTPYLYTLAYLASTSASPIIRPLWWEDPQNVDYYAVDDQFFLGDHLLIAPVLQPGGTTRTVLLPAGEWIDFWTLKKYSGPGPINVITDFSHIPIFIRTGAVLPLAENGNISLRIYFPSNEGEILPTESVLYSDDGDGYGTYRLDTFFLRRNPTNYELTWQVQGEYPFPYQQIQIDLIGKDMSTAFIDGHSLLVEHNSFVVPHFSKILFPDE